jgi:hypothetical protein
VLVIALSGAAVAAGGARVFGGSDSADAPAIPAMTVTATTVARSSHDSAIAARAAAPSRSKPLPASTTSTVTAGPPQLSAAQRALPKAQRDRLRADLRRARSAVPSRAPILDARRSFAALTALRTGQQARIYSDATGTVSARATNRMVCVDYRPKRKGRSIGTCQTTSRARRYGVYIVQCAPSAATAVLMTVAGLAPDGVTVVQAQRHHRTQASATVRHNGFILTTDQAIDAIALRTRTQTIPPQTC